MGFGGVREGQKGWGRGREVGEGGGKIEMFNSDSSGVLSGGT